jgi:hypothetical protein
MQYVGSPQTSFRFGADLTRSVSVSSLVSVGEAQTLLQYAADGDTDDDLSVRPSVPRPVPTVGFAIPSPEGSPRAGRAAALTCSEMVGVTVRRSASMTY